MTPTATAHQPTGTSAPPITAPSPSSPDGGDPHGSLRIGEVSRRSGVPANTIRSWERRHGFPTSDRTPGGHRVYPAHVVAEVAAVRDRVDAGQTVSAAIRALTAAPDAGSHQATAPCDVDHVTMEARLDALERMLAARSVSQITVAVARFVEDLGGRLGPAVTDGDDVLPIDCSFGVGDPLLPHVSAYSLARMRLESTLPRLVEHASIQVAILRAAGLD